MRVLAEDLLFPEGSDWAGADTLLANQRLDPAYATAKPFAATLQSESVKWASLFAQGKIKR
jgi:hypothetical protein